MVDVPNQKTGAVRYYAPVKLFCPDPPRGSPGVRGKMCAIKKGGALENEVKKGGVLENEGIKVID